MAKAKYSKGKDGYFRAKVWDGSYDEKGNKRRINVTSNKSSADLEKKVNDIKNKVHSKVYVADNNISFYDYAIYWLNTYKSSKSKNTYTMYHNIIKYYFKDFTTIRLQDFTRGQYQHLINSHSEKPCTCNKLRLTVNQIIKMAIKENILPPGVIDSLISDIDVPIYTSNQRRILNNDELKKILNANYDNKERCFLYLIAGCGLRRQEALALTKQDIDLTLSEIRIDKALCFDRNMPYIKTTKSIRGKRTVPIPGFLFDFLSQYITPDTNILISDSKGDYLTEGKYHSMWKRILRNIGSVLDTSEGITPHVFRHNYCTRLCYQIPLITTKKIASLLGDSEKMVIDVYSHILEEKENVSAAVGNVFDEFS